MRLKPECVRDVLLHLEENLSLNDFILTNNINLQEYSHEDIVYTVKKLMEANYINAQFHGYDNEINYQISSITWDGHQFLDNIRDNNIWKNTKEILSNFSSTSINIMQKVATQILINLISKSI